MSLSSLIVERGVASSREIEEALARQVLYGGDLVTNLFEVMPVDESALMPLVAESFGLSAAPLGELPRVSVDAARLVTAEVVAERSILPIELEGEVLVVAVAEPLPPEVEQELTFALAVRIEQRMAPLFRIRQALSRDYGVPLDRRMARLVTRVVEHGPEASADALAEKAVRLPPRPPSIGPAPRLESIELERGAEVKRGTFVRAVEALPPRSPRRRRGPLTAELAVEELEASAERDSIFDVVFEFARQFFDYTALFTVHGDLAEGRDAFGDGASRDKVARIGVPLDLGNLLATARRQRELVRARPSRDGLDPVLMSDLGRDGESECAVLPIVVRGRVVALLFGDGGASGIDDAGLDQVERLAHAASGAFERVIMRRKLGRAQSAAPFELEGRAAAAPSPAEVEEVEAASAPVAEERSESPPPTQVSRSEPTRATVDRPSFEELASPIHELMTEPVEPSLRASSWRASPRAPSRSPERPPLHMLGDERWPSLPSSERPPPPNMLAVRRPTGLPIPREEPDSVTLRAASIAEVMETDARRVPPPLPSSPPRRRSLTMRRAQAPAFEFGTPSIPSVTTDGGLEGIALAASSLLPAVDENLDPIQPLVVVTPDVEPVEVVEVTVRAADRRVLDDPDATPLAPPVIDPDMQETPIAPPVEIVLELAQRKEASRVLPPVSESKVMPTSEQQISVPAHKPPTSRSDVSRALPSVIIDVTSEYMGFVERVLAGPDEEAETALLRAGAYAMPAIMTKFPGPITIAGDRVVREPLPRVAECGPILRLVASQRRTALPFVLTHLGDGDVEARFWATYLMTELVYSDAIEPAIARAFDDDPRIRYVARAALRALAEAYPQPVVDELAEIASSGPPARRVLAVEALAGTREALAVFALLPLLDAAPDDIARAACAGLVVLARQDFGVDPRRWSAWWGENKDRHRIEWLVDALMHEKRALRAAASDELKTITKEYFGYYDDLPKRERERAQARYREWWEEVGRVRFSRASKRGS